MIRYFTVAVLVTLVGGFYVLNQYIYDRKQGGASDFKDVTFTMDNQSVTRTSEGITYFGNEAKGDLNSDTVPDMAFLVARSGGGSGTFYYVVAALQNASGRFNGTNAVFLGDRIAPQSAEIRNGVLIVNYADRGPDDPFTTPPYVGKSAYVYYDGELKVEWPVQLFYYGPEEDKDESGNLLCSEKGLVPVLRKMPSATIEWTIGILITGNLTDDEKVRGVTTEFPLEGLLLANAALDDGTLTLTFDDPFGATVGGACRVAILRAQIEATARQFPGVREVRIEPEHLFQP